MNKIIIALLFLILFSCAEKPQVINDTKTDINANEEKSDIINANEDPLEQNMISNYMIPSNYHIFNTLPEIVIQYKQGSRLHDILEENGVDIQKEIQEYLEKESKETKNLIFSDIP